MYKQPIFASGSTTGIGSLPHQSPAEAVETVLRGFDIPFWPQLPRRSILEGMVPQFSEGMPQIRIEPDGSVWASRDSEEELERFYETYTEATTLAISEDFAMGFHEFIRRTRQRRFKFLKGQITGPLTFTLGIRLKDGNPIYFDEELREISLMVLKAKARWQIQALKPQADNVVLFVDEPILSVIGGSAYLAIDPSEVERLLKELINSINSAGAISGIHCCGRADWEMVLRSGVRVLSFDSYEHFSSILASTGTFATNSEPLLKFLESGGYLAWGAVPTTEAINSEDINSLKRRLLEQIETLSKFIPERLLKSQLLLTPSCGMGSRTVEESHRIIQILWRIKEEIL